jgi:hypothetical protein
MLLGRQGYGSRNEQKKRKDFFKHSLEHGILVSFAKILNRGGKIPGISAVTLQSCTGNLNLY